MSKCACWKCENKATWAWQPFGPDESTYSFMTLGNHYRGFPVVKICDLCKERLEHGWALHFQGGGVWYEVVSSGEIHRVEYQVVA